MTWPDIKLTGSGRLRFRLEIEGWPEEFCSDPSITHEPHLDGRRMVPGLCSDGIATGERCVLQEAQLDQDMVRFKLVPAEPKFTTSGQVSDDMLESFTQTVEPVARLGSALAQVPARFSPIGEITQTTLVIDGTDEFAAGTVFHVGTETIRVTAWPEVSRSIWRTTNQHHTYADDEVGTASISYGLYDSYLYPRPTTMEGRRLWLHVYGDGDDGQHGGYQVWAGIVARPPYLDSDGVTWRIDAFGITQLFKQKLGANIVEVHPMGIYHHALCCIVFAWLFEDEPSNGGEFWKLAGFYRSEDEMITSINTWFADKLSTEPIGIITLDEMFSSIRLVKTADGLAIEMVRTDEDFYDSADFSLSFGSPILGVNSTEWIRNGVVIPNDGTFEAEGIYYAKVEYGDLFDGEDEPAYEGAPISPLGDGAVIMVDSVNPSHVAGSGGSFENTFHHQPSFVDFPPWRIYLDAPLHASGVHISGTAKPGGLFRVLNEDSDDGLFWIDVEPWSRPDEPALPGAFPSRVDHANFAGWLNSSTVIRPVREYATAGTLADFMLGVIDHATLMGNTGDSPFVTADDINFIFTAGQPVSQRQMVRDYRFFAPIPLWDVIREDCKFTNSIPRITFDGSFQVIPLTRWTERTPVDDDHVLDASCILTPYAGGGVGEWPTFEQQTDGRTTAVTIQEYFDAVEGQHKDDPTTFQDPRAIAVTKTRGRNPVSIKPYSTPHYASGTAALAEMKARIAEIYLAFFSIDYAVVRLQVPFTRFECLIGDVVAITYQNLPDGEGARGVTSRRGIVIQRRINYDAAIDKMIELTVLLTPRNIVGYAPSGILTAGSTGAGTTWTLEVDPFNAINLVLAKGGNVAAHFLVGDRIRVAPVGSGTVGVDLDYEVEGTVTSVSVTAGTVGVVFDDPWDPTGTSNWVLEFAKDSDNSSAAQKTYAHVSDDDLHLQDGSFTRRFS